MPKVIKAVIGMGFGDEGKGLMTDYFCSNFSPSEKVLNVRYNGTGQAGHGVELSDGYRHVFKHIGAGSFNGNVDTYLASTFYVSPLIFLDEYAKLYDIGIDPNVYVSEFCEVILPWDSMLNMLLEESRGDDRHGSCGVGLFEAVKRVEKGYRFNISDITYSGGVKDRLLAIRDTYYTTRLEELGLDISHSEYRDTWLSENLIDNFSNDLYEMLEIMFLNKDSKIKEYDNIVFEGAQGLLLDWGNREYMPYLTASYTGLKNVKYLLESQNLLENSDIEICYVTRSYMTRHGAGYFCSEVDSSFDLVGKHLIDKTNSYNTWQGHFRYGYLDPLLLLNNVHKDMDYLRDIDTSFSIAVTHLDETDNMLIYKNGRANVEDINSFSDVIGVRYVSYGPTRENVYRLE